jgi:hypothetical protein
LDRHRRLIDSLFTWLSITAREAKSACWGDRVRKSLDRAEIKRNTVARTTKGLIAKHIVAQGRETRVTPGRHLARQAIDCVIKLIVFNAQSEHVSPYQFRVSPMMQISSEKKYASIGVTVDVGIEE